MTLFLPLIIILLFLWFAGLVFGIFATMRAWQKKRWGYVFGLSSILLVVLAVVVLSIDIGSGISETCEGLGCIGLGIFILYLVLPALSILSILELVLAFLVLKKR